MSWVFEQPLAILAIGVVLTLALGGGWLQTGARGLLIALLAVLLLTGVMLVVERQTVTDREQITQTLHQGTRDVAANNVQAVLRYIHSSQSQLRDRAAAELVKHKFNSLRVTRIRDIRVDDQRQPPQAVAEFVVAGEGTFENGEFPNINTVRYLVLTLRKENGEWRVVDYEHHDIQESFMQREQPTGDR